MRGDEGRGRSAGYEIAGERGRGTKSRKWERSGDVEGDEAGRQAGGQTGGRGDRKADVLFGL